MEGNVMVQIGLHKSAPICDEPVSHEGIHLSRGRIAFKPFQMDGRSAP